MRIIPLSCGLGADIDGIDLRGALTADAVRELEQAAGRFGVLIFREQKLGEAEQLRLTRAFGDSDITHLTSVIESSIDQPTTSGMHRGACPDTVYWTHGPGFDDQGFPEADQGFGRFHSDLSYQETPLRFTILSAIEASRRGGETEFVDTAAAYAALDEPLKHRLHGLVARHVRNERGAKGDTPHQAVHPVVVRNPSCEIDALYVNRTFTQSIVGVADAETLLEQLFTFNECSPVRYRHVWRNGDVVLWDNFRVLHRRCGFPAGERRVLLRTQAKRQRPQAPPA
jgi:taurine dioxygenase